MTTLPLAKHTALLITSPANILYFSSIAIDSGVFLIITPTKKFICTDARCIREATRMATGFTPLVLSHENPTLLAHTLKKQGVKILYFEPYHLSYHTLMTLKKQCRGIAQLKPAPFNLREIRAIKTTKEIAHITQAAHIAEHILAACVHRIRNALKSGALLSEYDLVLAIHKEALAHGCEKLSFSPIIAFGKNTGVPHHSPKHNRRLHTGDRVLIDMGVLNNHYCSDITRTFFTAPPTTRQAHIYEKVLAAQKLALQQISHGAQTSKLVENINNFLGRDAKYFTHGLGHGVGLEIHEYPSLKTKTAETLCENEVITVEPGLYFSWGGVRIEDMVLVQKNGNRLLTHFPKELSHMILHR